MMARRPGGTLLGRVGLATLAGSLLDARDSVLAHLVKQRDQLV